MTNPLHHAHGWINAALTAGVLSAVMEDPAVHMAVVALVVAGCTVASNVITELAKLSIHDARARRGLHAAQASEADVTARLRPAREDAGDAGGPT